MLKDIHSQFKKRHGLKRSKYLLFTGLVLTSLNIGLVNSPSENASADTVPPDVSTASGSSTNSSTTQTLKSSTDLPTDQTSGTSSTNASNDDTPDTDSLGTNASNSGEDTTNSNSASMLTPSSSDTNTTGTSDTTQNGTDNSDNIPAKSGISAVSADITTGTVASNQYTGQSTATINGDASSSGSVTPNPHNQHQITIHYFAEDIGGKTIPAAGSEPIKWATKVLTVKAGDTYTLPVLNLEDDGLYVIKRKSSALTGTMGDKSFTANIYYGGLIIKTVVNSKKDTLAHYLSDPNGVLRFAEIDENVASNTILIFTFSQKDSQIEMDIIEDSTGTHKQIIYFKEGQKKAVTLLDGSRHTIQVKDGVIYDQTISTGNRRPDSSPQNVQTRSYSGNSRTDSINHYASKPSMSGDAIRKNHSTRLPQTSDSTPNLMRILGVGLLGLMVTVLISKKRRRNLK